MPKVFYNPKCGLVVAAVHVIVCVVISRIIINHLSSSLGDDSLGEKWMENAITICVPLLFLCVLTIVLCILLIVGILKQNHFCMAPWLGLTFAIIAANFMFVLVSTISSFINLLSLEENLLRIFYGLLLFVFHVSVFYPIFVLYKSVLEIRLKQEGNESDDTDDELVDKNELY